MKAHTLTVSTISAVAENPAEHYQFSRLWKDCTARGSMARPLILRIMLMMCAALAGAGCGGGGSGNGGSDLPPSANAVPTISSVMPESGNVGGASFTLTVMGTGFTSTSTIQWNGGALATSDMSATELTALVPAADIATAGAAQITVSTPTPGGGISNSLAFTIVGAAAQTTPAYVYVANAMGVSLTTGNITAFSVDPTSGALTVVPGSPFAAGANPTYVTVSPSNEFLYETSDLQTLTSANDLNAFAINITTGTLTAVPGSPFLSGSSPASVSIDSTGKFLYTSNGGAGNGPDQSESISEYDINATTGALTAIAQDNCSYPPFFVGNQCNAVLADPVAGFLFGTASAGVIDAFSIESQGTLQAVTGSPFPVLASGADPTVGPVAMAIYPTGKYLYTANYNPTTNVSGFNIAGSGALSLVPGSPFTIGNSNPSDLVADPLGRFLYVLDFNVGVTGFSVNPSNGQLTLLPGFPVLVPIFSRKAMAIDPSGKFLYVGSGLSYQAPSLYVFAINATTGGLTPIDGSPYTVDGTPQAIAVSSKAP
jgi:6-phosphogluconolactonase